MAAPISKDPAGPAALQVSCAHIPPAFDALRAEGFKIAVFSNQAQVSCRSLPQPQVAFNRSGILIASHSHKRISD